MSGGLKDRSAAPPGAFLQAKLESGQVLQSQGRVAEAAKIYEEILAADGAHFDALHGLGVIALQAGSEFAAIDLLSRAIAVMPEAPQPHSNLGATYQRLNRLDDALACYDRAIALQPDYARAWFNRGQALQSLGRLDEALASFSRATEHNPDYVQAHFHRGNAFLDLERPAEALEAYDRTLALQPGNMLAHYNRGNALYSLKRYDESLAAYESALKLKPDFAKAWCNRGNALLALKRRDEALTSFDRAIALKPEEAQFYYDRATVLQTLCCFNDSLADWDRAIARDPLNVKAHVNRGIVLHMLRRFDEVIAACDHAIALKPDLAAAYVTKGMAQLTVGDMAPGWENFEWRRLLEISPERKLAEPPLTSLADARGKTILVHGDDGFGDTLHFCRYIPLLQQAGAHVLFSPQKKLNHLMRTLGDGVTIAGEKDSFDYHIPAMSLPLLFQTTLDTIPTQVPYLFADAARIEKWRARIGDQGFKIGICWQGNSAHLIVDGRCCPLVSFAPLARLAGVRLISLHKGSGEEQLSNLPDGMTVERFDDLDTGPDAFADTAAVMQCMDLVITIDTSVAHLVGALGVRSWVLLQQVPEWRWLLDRDDSPWYPAMRLFRQKRDGDWTGLFVEVEAALVGLLKETAPQKANAQSHTYRGFALHRMRRFDEALAAFDQAIALKPDSAEAWYWRGNCFLDMDRLAEALEAYDRAMTLQPDHALAQNHRGNVLYLLQRHEEALAAYENAIALQPDLARAWCNRGSVLLVLRRREEALASFDRAVILKPQEAQFHCDRATGLQALDRFGDALVECDLAIALEPANAPSHTNRGIVLHMLRRFEEAIASYDRAVALQPDLAMAYVKKAETKLTRGHLAAAWKDYEWRRLLKASRDRKLAEPALARLAEAKGKTVLVHCDGGFGDTIQFCRYLPLLRQAGARVLLSPQKKLERLMRSLEGVTLAGEKDKFDCHIPLMSLPMLFQTTLDTIPAKLPYLSAEAALVKKWRVRIGVEGFKIGICWQGNSASEVVDRRCCDVAYFAPLARLAGVRLISLHKGSGEGQLDGLPDGMAIEHFDELDAGPDAFADTAAVMQCMDLVITIDTSVAHLAGALGVRSWVLLQQVPEWRWLLDRDDSPWYPAMRLFRQKRDGDWTGLFFEVEAALVGLLKEPAP